MIRFMYNVSCLIDYNDNATYTEEILEESFIYDYYIKNGYKIPKIDDIKNIIRNLNIKDKLDCTMYNIYKKFKIKYKFMKPTKRIIILTFYMNINYHIIYYINLDTKKINRYLYTGNTMMEKI